MRSLALVGLLCFVVAGCRCPWLCGPNDSRNGQQGPREQTGPAAAPGAASPPQRVVIEVVQKPAELPMLAQPGARQAISPSPAPVPPPAPGVVPYAQAPAAGIGGAVPAAVGGGVVYQAQAAAAGLPTGVVYQTQAAPSPSLLIDVGAIFDWIRAPFLWLRLVNAPPQPSVVLQQWPQYVQPASYGQPMTVMPQAFPGYFQCPPCPPCAQTIPPPTSNNLRAADLDEITRRVRELRSVLGN